MIIDLSHVRVGKRLNPGGSASLKIMNQIGRRYGKLVVVRKSELRYDYFVCRCDCGNEKEFTRSRLRKGTAKSCGCVKSMSNTSEYKIWQGMIARCHRSTSKAWRYYGGRGIRVCDEWRRDFQAFLKHVGPRPSLDRSIDRINNDGNYEPGNVRWATRHQQATNRSKRVRL
jgi:hypothetical protein